jgi:hypothetical protein
MILAHPKDWPGAGVIDIYPPHIGTKQREQVMIELPAFGIETRNEIGTH